MNELGLIRIEWNSTNGFIFQILPLDCNKPNIDSCLFGINFSKDFFQLQLFYFEIIDTSK